MTEVEIFDWLPSVILWWKPFPMNFEKFFPFFNSLIYYFAKFRRFKFGPALFLNLKILLSFWFRWHQRFFKLFNISIIQILYIFPCIIFRAKTYPSYPIPKLFLSFNHYCFTTNNIFDFIQILLIFISYFFLLSLLKRDITVDIHSFWSFHFFCFKIFWILLIKQAVLTFEKSFWRTRTFQRVKL